MPKQDQRARAVPPPPGGRAGRASYGDVFAVGEFRIIFVADVVAMLGNIVAAVALTVLV